jgi:hypothetical protein
MARAYTKENIVERESQDYTWRRAKLRCALIPMQIISDSDTDLHMFVMSCVQSGVQQYMCKGGVSLTGAPVHQHDWCGI